MKAAEDAVAAIRAVASNAGVAHHERNFDATSTAHAEAARRWLISSVVMAFLALVAVIVGVAMFGVKEGATSFSPFVIQNLVAKAIIVSVVYYALLQCLKNYRVHRHLTVMNEHRRNALKTFEAFVAAAKDDTTKAAVLLETTKAIFAPSATGYTGADDEVAPTKLLELLSGRSGARPPT